MANDVRNFKVDQAATFDWVRFLGCEPKTVFGDPYRQEMTKDGLGKFTAQVAVQLRQFGRAVNALLPIGLAGETDPCAGMEPGTPVELVDFEIGVMEKVKRDKNTGQEQVVGVQVWYRAGQIRPISATGSDRKRGQHQPPEQAAS